jgi:hypothetical protein
VSFALSPVVILFRLLHAKFIFLIYLHFTDVAGKKSIVMSEKNLTFCLSHQQNDVNKKKIAGK